MAEVLSPAAASISSSPPSQNPESPREAIPPLPQPRAKASDRSLNYAQHRMSQYSQSSDRSRSRSAAPEFPAFPSSLPYALVRDFAYPVFNPLHYGAVLEPSGDSTPASESQWDARRRSSDPMDQWNGSVTTHTSGWSAGPWGGDGVLYGDPKQDDDLTALPSTSFANDEAGDTALPLELEGDDLIFKKEKLGKSKSYASPSDFERGRRRESAGRAEPQGSDSAMFMFQGQQSDPAGRDRLRLSRGTGQRDENDSRTDSRNARTLPDSSFHSSQASSQEGVDPDERIPLDTETSAHAQSPVRDSMGPEDEELFAGPSLALYSFEPENSNELRLVEGQEIMVSYRHGQGWLVASDPRSGEQGLVPEAYVRLIADMPNYDPETGEFVDVDSEVEESFESAAGVGGPQDEMEDLSLRQRQQTQDAVDSKGDGGQDEVLHESTKAASNAEAAPV